MAPCSIALTLEMLAYGGQSPPASISRQGFAGKSLQSELRIFNGNPL
jgi:hypothetical protein